MAKKVDKHRGNKYAHLSSPQAVLDYHGRGILTEEEIRNMAEQFVLDSQKKGLKRLLIITGKGLHSGNGPIIGPLLVRYLPQIAAVQSVEMARRDRGGEGALEVMLW